MKPSQMLGQGALAITCMRPLTNRTETQKTPRLLEGSFVPKPKPMRRIALLLGINTGGSDFGYEFLKE